MSLPAYAVIISLLLPQSDMWLFTRVPMSWEKRGTQLFKDCWRQDLIPGDLKLCCCPLVTVGARGSQVINGVPSPSHSGSKDSPCDHFLGPLLYNWGSCTSELAGPWLWFCDPWKRSHSVAIPWNRPLLAETVSQKQHQPRRNCRDLGHQKTLKGTGVLPHHIPIQLTCLAPKVPGGSRTWCYCKLHQMWCIYWRRLTQPLTLVCGYVPGIYRFRHFSFFL